jgi:hypothetical protein
MERTSPHGRVCLAIWDPGYRGRCLWVLWAVGHEVACTGFPVQVGHQPSGAGSCDGWMLLAADGDYRKVGNGTTTRALRFVSILKSHQSSNRSHQGHGKRRKASGRSCLSAFATACTAGRTSAGICATAASSRYAEASARCLSARSRRSGVRRTTLNESLMARQTVRCGLRALPSCAPINRDHDREHDRKSDFCFEVEIRNRAARLAGPPSRNIEHPLKKILLYRRCNQFTDELANPHIS